MLPGAIAAVACLAMLAFGFAQWRRRRLLTDVPTSKVRGVFIGLNEVKGTAQSAAPLTSQLARQPCVWFSYKVEEEHTRTVTSTDSQGHTSTRTEHYWKTRDQGDGSIPFDLTDDTGALRVDPDGANVKPASVYSETRDEGGGGGLLSGLLSSATGKVRYTEDAILIGAELYVLGPARLRPDVAEPELAADKDVGPFVISTGTEEQLVRGYGWKFAACFVVGLAAAALAGTLLIDPATDRGQPLSIGAGLGLALVLLAIGWLWLDWNSLVRVRQRQERAGSLIDVQLKRRADLIPPLVSVVEAVADHEEVVQQLAAAGRAEGLEPGGRLANGSTSANQAGATTQAQSGSLRTVIAIAERYPALQANQSFTDLQHQLVDTEDRIALARQYYNDSVTAMADRARPFPTNLVAKLGRFSIGELYLAAGFERTPVTI